MELLIDNWHITDHKQGNQCEKHFRAKVKSHTSHTSFRSYPPCRRIQIPSLIFSAYLQSFLSHWHPALIGRNIFFLTVHENGTLWDSLYMFNTILKVMYHHAMCCVTSAAPIILLSATQILESSWICVSFIKHKIRNTDGMQSYVDLERKCHLICSVGQLADQKFQSQLVFLSLYQCLVPKENKSTRRN